MSIAATEILFPLFAMMGLVIVVASLLLRERARQFKAIRLDIQQLSTRGAVSDAMKDSRCADNFANLFETPVLFYVVCIGLYVTHSVSFASVVLAWLYVAGRIGHSAVHCGRNIVMTRFALFLLSLLMLLALWVCWAVALLS